MGVRKKTTVLHRREHVDISVLQYNPNMFRLACMYVCTWQEAGEKQITQRWPRTLPRPRLAQCGRENTIVETLDNVRNYGGA